MNDGAAAVIRARVVHSTPELQSGAFGLLATAACRWSGPRESDPPGRLGRPLPNRSARPADSLVDGPRFERGMSQGTAELQGFEPWRRIAAAIAFPTRALGPLGHCSSVWQSHKESNEGADLREQGLLLSRRSQSASLRIARVLVPQDGVEPPTPELSTQRSTD